MSSNPYQSPYEPALDAPAPSAPPAPPHSGPGIASFALAIASGGILFVMIGMATYMAAANPDQLDNESAQAILVGLGIMGGMGLAVLGLGLGIAGVAQSNRNKLFAILGLVLNGCVLVAVCGLMGLGLAVG